MRPFLASVFTIVALPLLGFAQQPPNPGSRPPDDAATFGNQHSPKKEKGATTRTVSGQVTDQSGQILVGALVTLTDKKTNEKTSFFTKKDGRYQFADLSFHQDYEVQARYKDNHSDMRKISQFDGSPKPVRILEIPVKPAAPAASH